MGCLVEQLVGRVQSPPGAAAPLLPAFTERHSHTTRFLACLAVGSSHAPWDTLLPLAAPLEDPPALCRLLAALTPNGRLDPTRPPSGPDYPLTLGEIIRARWEREFASRGLVVPAKCRLPIRPSPFTTVTPPSHIPPAKALDSP